MKNELISVIIPAYNAAKTISSTLDPLLKQTYDNIEIIIINDGSKDNTKEIVEQFSKKFRNIRLLNLEKNIGLVGAYIHGIKNAIGKYICFVDADDIVTTNYVHKLAYPLLNDSALELCVANYTREFKDTKTTHNIFLKTGKYDNTDIFYETIFGKTIAPMRWSKMFKKEVIMKFIDRLDLSVVNSEDVVFTLLYINKINSFYYVDESIYYYTYNEKSLSNKNSIKKINSLQKVIDILNENIDSCNIDKVINTIAYARIDKIMMLDLNSKNRKKMLSQVTSYKIRKKYNSNYIWGSIKLKEKIIRQIQTLSPILMFKISAWIRFIKKC